MGRIPDELTREAAGGDADAKAQLRARQQQDATVAYNEALAAAQASAAKSRTDDGSRTDTPVMQPGPVGNPRGTQVGVDTTRSDDPADIAAAHAEEDASPRAGNPGAVTPENPNGKTGNDAQVPGTVRVDRSASPAEQQIAKDKNLAATGGDVDALLAKRKDYTVPQELQDVYGQIQSQLNGDQDAYLKTRQDISRHKESQGLSNVYRNATSGGDAQIGAGQVVAQYGQDSNEDLASDLQQKTTLRQQGLAGAQALADEHNNQYIYNQQFPLEQRLEFLKQKKQNAANIQIADIAGQSAQTGGILSAIGSLASAAILA